MAIPHILTVLLIAEVSSNFSAHNFHFHKEDDIVAALASSDGSPPQFVHAWPPNQPYAYTHYAPLIAKSQGIDPESCIDLSMPSHIAQDILLMQCSWIERNAIKQERIDDVVKEWAGAMGSHAILDLAFGIHKNVPQPAQPGCGRIVADS